jgi:hypothetical protein
MSSSEISRRPRRAIAGFAALPMIVLVTGGEALAQDDDSSADPADSAPEQEPDDAESGAYLEQEDGESVDEVETAAECFPSCRTGFLCHEGECISRCNPPCSQDERCTADGECELRQPAPTVSARASSPEPTPPAPVEPDRFNREGLQLQVEGGGSFWHKGSFAREMPLGHGGQIGAAIGWRINGWVALDLSFKAAILSEDGYADHDDDNPEGDGASSFWTSAPQLGIRAYPLGARQLIDIVLGFRVGYVRAIQRYEWIEGPDQEPVRFEAMLRGVSFVETLGLDLHLNHWLTMGIAFTVFSPYWTQYCNDYDGAGSDYGDGPSCTANGEEHEGPIYDRKTWESPPLMFDLSLVLTLVLG